MTRHPPDSAAESSPDADAELRKAIRKAVTAADRQQTEVATAAGFSWPQWTRRMSSKPTTRSRWTVDEVRRVADVLGVPLAQLIGDDAPTEDAQP